MNWRCMLNFLLRYLSFGCIAWCFFLFCMQCNMKHTSVQWLFLHFIWITWNKHSFMIPTLHNIFVNILAYQSCNIPCNRICKSRRNGLKNTFFLIMGFYWICLMLLRISFILYFVNCQYGVFSIPLTVWFS